MEQARTSSSPPASSEPHRSRRVLLTGVASPWGGRLAQALEDDPEIEAIVGVDSEEPTRELGRTEYVRVGTEHALIRRIVQAARLDTVVDTRLIVDSSLRPRRQIHETNVIGTMNILAACSGPETPVRKLVFKSSAHYYGCRQDDPAFFGETMQRPDRPRTAIERDVVEAEAAVADHARRNPGTSVAVLRVVNVLGPGMRTAHTRLLDLPAVPMVLGFDPRYQFVHTDDVVRALSFAVERDLHGVYNVAADGVLALSEVISLLGKVPAPIISPYLTPLAALPLRAAGIRIPEEMLVQMRFGRGLDNRLLKSRGFAYDFTTRETVQRLAVEQHLHPLQRDGEEYRYEREVEDFLRRSPLVRDAE